MALDEDLTAETKVSALAERWYTGVEKTDKALNTKRAYRDRLDKQIIPGLGGRAIRDLGRLSTIDRFLTTIETKHGASTAKMCRSVLSGMCGLAARHDALDRNPVRDAAAISTKPERLPRALTVAEGRQLRAWLTYDDKAIGRDLPDVIDILLATGLRIGEASAIVWDAVDLDAGTIEVRGTVIRVKGEGLVIQPKPKTKAGYRTLTLPSWAVDMLKRRYRDADDPTEQSPVFTAPKGGLRDPSNTQADLREAFDFAGFDWLTSHLLGRKTVATEMDKAGLSARAAADQLGQQNPSMTQDRYMGRGARDTGAANVLEAFGFVAA
ncbi:tyrosine recombinase XerC [Cryptosporangium sp. NPDC051539]|uniref:tyrosine recombinase XerC n=1 Tax=Cryptosporangium sp. NPDC051539 TaxID=3363962 RepID=UPI0037BADA54